MTEKEFLHAGAWMLWLAAVLTVLTVTRNPIYLLLTLVWIGVVAFAVTSVPGIAHGQPFPVKWWQFGLIVVTLSTVFNAFSVHVGRAVIFRLPASWPLIGGPVTWEAAVYGALNGLALTGLFVAFGIVVRAVAIRDLVQLIPRAYYPVAIVVAIAVTYAPSTLRQIGQIREAQAIRGHQVSGLRSWLPLFLPLLTSGLERALQLAEAMTARGYAGGGANHVTDRWSQPISVLALPVVAGGLLLRLAWGLNALGMAVVFAGLSLLVAAVWQAGRRHPHTVYRRNPWRWQDWTVAAGTIATIGVFLVPWPGLDRSSLFYTPYPSLTVPDLHPVLGAATWGLLAPLVGLIGR